MSKLSAFLHPVTTSEEKEVVISNRFQDESGQPVPFKIRALTQEENDAITRQATRRRKEGGQTIEQLDSVDFTRRMVVAATVEPDTEMLVAYYCFVNPGWAPSRYDALPSREKQLVTEFALKSMRDQKEAQDRAN